MTQSDHKDVKFNNRVPPPKVDVFNHQVPQVAFPPPPPHLQAYYAPCPPAPPVPPAPPAPPPQHVNVPQFGGNEYFVPGKKYYKVKLKKRTPCFQAPPVYVPPPMYMPPPPPGQPYFAPHHYTPESRQIISTFQQRNDHEYLAFRLGGGFANLIPRAFDKLPSVCARSSNGVWYMQFFCNESLQKFFSKLKVLAAVFLPEIISNFTLLAASSDVFGLLSMIFMI